MKKVFCMQCKHFLCKDSTGTIFNDCEHPSNLYMTDSWIAPDCTGYHKKAKEINANNDCPNFEQIEYVAPVEETRWERIIDFMRDDMSDICLYIGGLLFFITSLIFFIYTIFIFFKH